MNKIFINLQFLIRLKFVLALSLLFVGCPNPQTTSDTNSVRNNSTNAKAKDAATGTNSNVESVQKTEVLWDFRKTGDSKIPNFPTAETKAVFTYLFGDKWDKELTISSRVSGSFTKPNAKETLYYIGGCEEEDFKSNANCGHVSWWNAGRIVIFDGTTPVLKINAALGYEVVKVTDVNSDGIDEIIGLTGFTNQGITETHATLGHMVGGKFEEIKKFSGYSDYCGSIKKSEQLAKAEVISYVPTTNGKIPDFSEEYFQGGCDNSNWKKITKKRI